MAGNRKDTNPPPAPTIMPSTNVIEQVVNALDPNCMDRANFCNSGLKVHPLADMFPMIEGKEFEELCLDLQSSGLQNPIVVLNGVLLDGRNRLRACAKTGIQPKFADYGWRKDREDEWIISQNLHRRSVTADQRAALVAKYFDWRGAQERARQAILAGANRGRIAQGKPPNQKPGEATSLATGETRNVFAERAGVSTYKAEQVILIARNKPELLDDVLAGTTPLTEAARLAREAVGKIRAKRDAWDLAREVRRFAQHMETVMRAVPEGSRAEFQQAIRHIVEGLCK